MSIGISEMFASSNRQARQNTRSRIFFENHLTSVRQTIIFALLGTIFMGGDWALDADFTLKSTLYRGGILAVLLFSALLKWLSKSLYLNYAVAYLSLALCEILLILLLNGLDGGLKAGVGQFLYFFLGTVLFCIVFPFNYNTLGCVGLTAIPFAVGIPFTFNFPVILYASVLTPALILTIIIHWRIRFILVAIQNSQLDMEMSELIEPVTGLLNYRGFERTYKRTIKLGMFKPSQQFLLLIEIEGLEAMKTVIGEKQTRLLQGKLGELIESSLDLRNITACFGDSEFACILQNLSQEEAYAHAESLRKTIAGKEFDCPAMETGKVFFKASIGIVSADTKDEMKTLINRARINLNHAVSLGGNQCVTPSREN